MRQRCGYQSGGQSSNSKQNNIYHISALPLFYLPLCFFFVLVKMSFWHRDRDDGNLAPCWVCLKPLIRQGESQGPRAARSPPLRCGDPRGLSEIARLAPQTWPFYICLMEIWLFEQGRLPFRIDSPSLWMNILLSLDFNGNKAWQLWRKWVLGIDSCQASYGVIMSPRPCFYWVFLSVF